MEKEKERKISDWLERRVGQENFKPGLERIEPLFRPIINSLHAKIIIVGGTNGKGSVCFTLEKLLRDRGLNVALWSSPHILSVRERFRVKGEIASYNALETLFEEHAQQIESYKLSYYEFLFYSFCHYAKEADYLILEVGLGGRFDAVNLFEPTLTAITSIGRDHQAILGRSYRAILGEKLGITRSSVPLLTSFNLDYLKERTASYIQRNEIPWSDFHQEGATFEENNSCLAAELAKSLLGKKEIESVVAPSKGRFETISYKNKSLTFVGSHNLAGMRELVKVVEWNNFDLVLLSFSKRDRKEIESCIKLLQTTGTELILTSFDHSKAAENLESMADWKKILEESTEGSILVTGSYYFVGEVQKYILRTD